MTAQNFINTVSLVTLMVVTLPAQAHDSRRDGIISLARQFVGGRYIWGGNSPQSGGFDCSGLVQYVYGKHGIRLPRVAEDQYQVGTPVRFEELQPGDLIFQANTYKLGISHVGIYIGEGKMLHAKGKDYGIVIDSVSPFGPNHPGARRILAGNGAVSSLLPPPPTFAPAATIKGVVLQNLPRGVQHGTVQLAIGYDPYPATTTVEYAIEIDGEQAVVSAEAGVLIRFDTTQLADGEHVVKLVRRNKNTGDRFIAQTTTITTENYR